MGKIDRHEFLNKIILTKAAQSQDGSYWLGSYAIVEGDQAPVWQSCTDTINQDGTLEKGHFDTEKTAKAFAYGLAKCVIKTTAP